ncbi:MAG: ABC transporter ATP-binding protein [Ruminococcaceae bacterium]|nr:ABC transporter ATP-binding protein [Oscillospiraceae bacterium]
MNEQSRIDFKVWKRIVPFFAPHKNKFIFIALMMLFSAVVDAVVPLFTRYAVNNFVVTETTKGMGAFVLLYLVLILLQTATTVIYSRLSMEIEMHSSRMLKRECFIHIQKLPLSYFSRNSVGYILARVMSDTNHISGMIAWALFGLVWQAFYLISLITAMFFVNWRFALIVSAVVPIALLASLWFRPRLMSANRDVRHHNSAITGFINEHINGAKTTKTLVAEEKSASEFKELTRKMYSSNMRVSHLNSLFIPLVSLLGSVAVAAALFTTGSSVIRGTLDFGVLSAFISFAICIIDPIVSISGIFNEFIAVQVNVERVSDLLSEDTEDDESQEVKEIFGNSLLPKTENYPPIIGDIRFEHVWFRYPDADENDFVLKDISFDIPAGSTVALVGETGAGKSTLVNLVCRFFEPSRGKILIDGVDYRERSRHWLHSNLGYVQQSPQLFSGSVAYNILYGNMNATEEDMIKTAELVSVDKIAARLENGYETDVGENGDRLSTGEKQLVSFARAMLADPPLFILDEATSSIDTETEALIQNAISRVLPGRTSFIIAHRLSTIRNADIIMVVENHSISEKGSHEELMEKKGRYYRLYRAMQMKDESGLDEKFK